MDGFENKPLPIEEVESQTDGSETNDTSEDEANLEECSIFMRKNLQREKIDTDNDGDPDAILEQWDDCDGHTVSRIEPIPFSETEGNDPGPGYDETGGNEGGVSDGTDNGNDMR